MNGQDELFYAMDDLIAELHDIAEDEELDDDTILLALRAKLTLFKRMWDE